VIAYYLEKLGKPVPAPPTPPTDPMAAPLTAPAATPGGQITADLADGPRRLLPLEGEATPSRGCTDVPDRPSTGEGPSPASAGGTSLALPGA
jgi:hypothetical protein